MEILTKGLSDRISPISNLEDKALEIDRNLEQKYTEAENTENS